MIIVTGGAGFVGSVLVWRLNEAGRADIVVADHLGSGPKWKNLAKRQVSEVLHKHDLFAWLERHGQAAGIEAIFHIGACSSTTETDVDYLMRNNFQYSVDLFRYATRMKIPFVYASSGATYGLGENGFGDDPAGISKLVPTNPYGWSKQLFDAWVLRQVERPPVWVGLKYFNVYGPQEYHKGGQASVVFHAFSQVRDAKSLKLFKSENKAYAHGEQKRDFIYVKDVADVMMHVLSKPSNIQSGIYNLGTGTARTWSDLGRAVFAAVGAGAPKFEWIDMPASVRGHYQYFTEAKMDNLRRALRWDKAFTTLEDGVRDYVAGHLMKADPFL